MNCRISLINTTKNKVEKTEILSGSYRDAEIEVTKRNDKQKNKEKYWKVTDINI